MPGVFNFDKEGRKKVEGLHSRVEWSMADFHRERVPVDIIEQHVKRRLIQHIADLIDKEFDELPLEISTKADNNRGSYQFKLDMILISEDEYRRLHWKDRLFKTPEEIYGDDKISAVLVADGDIEMNEASKILGFRNGDE